MLINSEMLVYHPKKLVKSIVHYFLFTILKTGAAQYFMFLEKGAYQTFGHKRINLKKIINLTLKSKLSSGVTSLRKFTAVKDSLCWYRPFGTWPKVVNFAFLLFANYCLVLSAHSTSIVYAAIIIRIQLLGPLRHDVWPPYLLGIFSFGAPLHYGINNNTYFGNITTTHT